MGYSPETWHGVRVSKIQTVYCHVGMQCLTLGLEEAEKLSGHLDLLHNKLECVAQVESFGTVSPYPCENGLIGDMYVRQQKGRIEKSYYIHIYIHTYIPQVQSGCLKYYGCTTYMYLE